MHLYIYYFSLYDCSTGVKIFLLRLVEGEALHVTPPHCFMFQNVISLVQEQTNTNSDSGHLQGRYASIQIDCLCGKKLVNASL